MNRSELPPFFQIAPEVAQALAARQPVVALESTVITHGLPFPENLTLAGDMETEVRSYGVTPATIAVLDGRVRVGLSPAELQRLSGGGQMVKISTRDIAPAVARGLSGGTTVAATMLAAHLAGIQVFATGGIGGVHREASFDVSADLPQLSKTPLVVVCAGAKAILDLPATLEYLETASVPVVGYRTNEFPAFYSRSSGLKTSARVDSPEEAAGLARAHWRLGLQSAVLVTNPPPEEVALPAAEVEQAVRQALQEAKAQRIRGQEVTPFLLGQVSRRTGGASLTANLGLLRSNARLAAEIARHLGPELRTLYA